MDSNSIHALRAVKPVAIDIGSGKRTNSFAINTATGLIVSISSEGKLVYALSKSKLKKTIQLISPDEGAVYNVLPLTDGKGDEKYFYDEFIKHKFNNISFSDDGSALLVWSSNSVGFITLSLTFQYSSQVYDDSKFLESCKFSLLMTNLQQGMITQSFTTSTIVKACFHPFSSHHVVTLYEIGLLVVTDIISMKSTKIPLNREYSFVSFCFGPHVDWMAASIFLLERKGDVFILCPILPYSCQMSESLVEDMYMWLEEQRNDGTSGGDTQKYIYRAKEYLLSAFSHIGSDEAADEDEDEDSNRGSSKNSSLVLLSEHPVLAGVNHSILPQSIHFGTADRHQQTTSPMARYPYSRQQQQQLRNPDDNINAELRSVTSSDLVAEANSNVSLPLLQGPLRIQRKCREQRIAIDICVPSSTNNGGRSSANTAVPVVVICFTNGNVESLLVGGGGNASTGSSLQSVGPCWLMAEEELDSDGDAGGRMGGIRKYPCPGLLLIETISLSESLYQSQLLQLPPQGDITSQPLISNTINSSSSSNSSKSHNTWLLTPDPVHSHCLHVTSQDDCASFLISLKWLANLLESQKVLYQEELLQLEEQQYNNGYRNDDDDDDDDTEENEIGEGVDYYDYNNNHEFSATKLQQQKPSSLRQLNSSRYYPTSPSPSPSASPPYRSSPLMSPMQSNVMKSNMSGGGRRGSLDSIAENSRNNMNYTINREEVDGDSNKYDMFLEASLIIPVFCPLSNQQTTGGQQPQPQPFTTTSSSNRSQSTNTDVNMTNINSNMTLSGTYFGYDSLHGHYALFQTNTGLVASVNLTAHMQFCESQIAFQEALSSSGNRGINRGVDALDLKVSQRQQQLHEEALSKLLQNAITGLSVVPVSPTVASMKVTDVNDTKSPAVVAVHRARSHLDTEVCLPLHEAGQRLKYRLESLKDTYKIQMELITGGTQSANVTAATAGAPGVKDQIQYLDQENEELLIRLENMRNKCEEQKERMEDALRIISLLKSKITPAERNYHQTLSTWSQTAVQLEAKLLQLQNQSDVLQQKQQQQLLMVDANPQTPKTAAASSSLPVTLGSVTAITGTSSATVTPKIPSSSSSSSSIKKPKPFTFSSPAIKKPPPQQQQQQQQISQPPSETTTPTQTSAFKRYTLESSMLTSNSRMPTRVTGLTSGVSSPQQQLQSAVMTQEDIDNCLKLQSSQTELLHAGMEEIIELEIKIRNLRRKFAV